MKKNLLALAISIAMLVFSANYASAQECPEGANGGTVTPPARTTFCLGVSDPSSIAVASNPSSEETLLPDFTYVILTPQKEITFVNSDGDVETKQGEFIVGLAPDGGLDFSSAVDYSGVPIPGGTYSSYGFAYDQVQLDNIATTLNGDVVLQTLLAGFGIELEYPLPTPFPLEGLLVIAEGVFGPLTVTDVEDGIAVVAAVIGDICYGIDYDPEAMMLPASAYHIEVSEDAAACLAANDACTGAIAFDLPSENLELTISGPFANTDATASDDEPKPDCYFEDEFGYDVTFDQTVWFSFMGDGGTYHIYTSRTCADGDLGDTYINDGDTQMAVYTGECGSANFREVACNEDDSSAPGYSSADHWPAGFTLDTEMGTTYYVMLDGFNADGAVSEGEFCIHAKKIDCSGAGLTFADDVPESLELCPGDEFQVTFTAESNLGETDDPNQQVAWIIADTLVTGDPLDIPADNVLAFYTTTSGNSTTLNADELAADEEIGTGSFYVYATALTFDGDGDAIRAKCSVFAGPMALSVPESCNFCTAVGGEVSTNDATTICVGDGSPDEISVTSTGSGENYAYVVTDDQNNILAGPVAGTTFSNDFDGASSGATCRIWGVAYDGEASFPGVGENASGIAGDCVFLSDNFIEVVRQDCFSCEASFGTVNAPANTSVCPGLSLSFSTNGATAAGYTTAFVITQGADLSIVGLSTDGIIGGLDPGDYTVHAFNILNEDLPATDGVSTGGEVAAAIADGAICAALDVAGTPVTFLAGADPACIDPPVVCPANGGSISTNDPTTVCSGDGTDDIINIAVDGAAGDYQFVVTDANNVVLAVTNNAQFNIEGAPANATCYIYGLASEGEVTVGATISNISGDCYALSSNRIEVLRLSPITIAANITCSEVVDGEYELTLSVSGGLPDYDDNAVYSVEGNYNGVLRSGEEVLVFIQDGMGYSFTATDGTCSAEASMNDVTCAKCENEIGEMSITEGDGLLCEGEAITVASVGEVLGTAEDDNGNEVVTGCVIYALHTAGGQAAGTIIAANETGTFTYEEIAVGGNSQLYISAVIVGGCDDGFQPEDLSHPCTRVTPGVPVQAAAPIVITDNKECFQNSGFQLYNIAITGGLPPFIVSGPVNGQFGQGENISFTLEDGSSFTLSVTDAAGCTHTFSDEVECKKTPIELLGFGVEAATYSNILNWQTATEVNGDFFAVERSVDGENFEQIGTVDAAGNSTTLQSYSFEDKQALAGTTYYRLRLVDLDGSIAYSEVEFVTRGESNFGFGSIRPVPVQDELQVVLTADSAKEIQINIYDVTGKQLANRIAQTNAGVNTYSMDASSFVPGIYILSITDGQTVINEKFIVE